MKGIVNMFIMLLCVMIGVSACNSQPKTQDKDPVGTFDIVDVDQFEKLVNDTQKVVVLDVRTLSEYEEGHINGAKQIDIKDNNFLDECRKQLPKSKFVAVYCRSGFRSATAAKILANDGYRTANLKEGIVGWTSAGKPVVNGHND